MHKKKNINVKYVKVNFKCPTEQQRYIESKKHIANNNIEIKDNEQIKFNKLQISFKNLIFNFFLYQKTNNMKYENFIHLVR